MQPPPETIPAGGVVLRRATPADAHDLYAFACDPHVMRFMDWPMPACPEDTAQHLEGAVARWDAGLELQWVILERLTGQCAGTLSCRPRGHAADFGYFLGRKHWGKGLATQAAGALLAWCETQPQIIRVWASADVENVRSRRLLERLGLQLEGVLRRATVRPNIGASPRDTAIYGKVRL
jgi:RimJ/RimL family protein N-acetyltransferase